MPSPKIKEFSFEYPHYRCWVTLVYHPTMDMEEMFIYKAKKIPELFKDHKPGELKGSAAVTSECIDHTIYVFCNSKTTILELHHELHHVTMELFRFIGAKSTADTEEPFAYISMAIFADLLHTLQTKCNINPSYFYKVK